MDQVGRFVADAVLGIDTLWGGDVMCPSGTGRFIADSWFSDEPLPIAYTRPSAAQVRETGGVGGKSVDRVAVEKYLREVNLPAAIPEFAKRLTNLAGCAASTWPAWPTASKPCGTWRWRSSAWAPAVPYARSVESSTGRPPEPSKPEAKRDRVAELLGIARAIRPPATAVAGSGGCVAARASNADGIGARVERAVIAYFDNLSARTCCRICPSELARVPRANINFLPIKDAWFSGSMNYLGRERNPDGTPQYEASYEINASLQISFPEFQQLVSHEVVPGHVTTFAYLQNLYVRGLAGFEATVLTMNTRAATLFEGLANNAILIAHGVTEIEQLPDEDMQIGVSAGAAAGRCQEPVVVSDLGRGQTAGGSCGDLAARFPGQRRARRQTVGRLGTASAAGQNVSAGLSRGNGESRHAEADIPAGARVAGHLRLLRNGGHQYRGLKSSSTTIL
jgi:hypothetical protein